MLLSLGLTVFLTGSFALLLATVGVPFVAWGFSWFRGPRLNPLSAARSQSIEILVPAHNEEAVIAATLSSLVRAAERLRSHLGSESPRISIRVGMDHCSDRTAQEIEKLARDSSVSIQAIENPGAAGKWNVLRLLIAEASADWVALVDSGSVWDENLLVAAWPSISASDTVGLAPSYLPKKAGLLEKLNWSLEHFLKDIENHSGGPVSVHGASVLYRNECLQLAMRELGNFGWLNDDVVIPLTLRSIFPGLRLVYLRGGSAGAWVSDIGLVSEVSIEMGRRRRMVVGNLQWIANLFLKCGRRSSQVALVASRRVLRLLWAYWAVMIVAGFALMILGLLEAKEAVLALAALATLFAVGFSGSNWVRRVSAALLSGLAVPSLLRDARTLDGIKWV